MTGQPVRDLEDLVGDVLALDERIDDLTRQRADLRAQIAAHGLGRYPTTLGVTVTVAPPTRRFDLDRAWTMLTPEQQSLCTSPDPRLVKAQLPQVLLDGLMVAGSGSPVVTIR